jgi:hypothetical protein
VLCADGPVRSLAGLSLAAEHRRGTGCIPGSPTGSAGWTTTATCPSSRAP